MMNKGVKMHFKSVTENLFTVVVPIADPSSKPIVNPKGYLESFLSIRKTNIVVNSNSSVIPPS